MNISTAARKSGLSTKTIRYYESVGLIRPAARHDNGYRIYSPEDIEQLRFIHHARQVGFGLDECQHLLDLYRNPSRRSAHVKTLVLEKIEQVENKINDLKSMQVTLKKLAKQCAGDEGPECAIIETLAGKDNT